MDGSPDGSNMTLRNAVNFGAGDILRVSLDMGGSQRSRASDVFGTFLEFDGNTSFSYFLGRGGLANFTSGSRTASMLGVEEDVSGGAKRKPCDVHFDLVPHE
jgi:hypothetical protein